MRDPAYFEGGIFGRPFMELIPRHRLLPVNENGLLKQVI